MLCVTASVINAISATRARQVRLYLKVDLNSRSVSVLSKCCAPSAHRGVNPTQRGCTAKLCNSSMTKSCGCTGRRGQQQCQSPVAVFDPPKTTVVTDCSSAGQASQAAAAASWGTLKSLRLQVFEAVPAGRAGWPSSSSRSSGYPQHQRWPVVIL